MLVTWRCQAIAFLVLQPNWEGLDQQQQAGTAQMVCEQAIVVNEEPIAGNYTVK